MRREGEPYNGYPMEGHQQHHHQFGSPRGEDGGSFEHRPPPRPSWQEYGTSAPHDYEQGPYGQPPRPGPYDEQRSGGYEQRHNASLYPPGQSYGEGPYHASPYAPAPMRQETEAPRRGQIPGMLVRLHCKADPNYSLGVVPGQGPVMLATDLSDDYQVWYKDETMSTRVKDETGACAFSLINKVTGQALRHPPEDLKQCLLAEYEPNGRDETVWWTMSEDMGQGYRCIRLATEITRNLDVLRGDKKSGGVKQGSPAITFAWKKQENQIWKMTPA